jgi:hypothetical protein
MISDSQWNTRGWTYQEARLSRRCYFFTQYQVYFVCRESTRSEAAPLDSKSCCITSLLNNTKLDASLFGSDDSLPEGLIRDRLMFSRRSLTYERDVLDAFRGILACSPFITFWGVSVIPPGSQMNPCLGFALGLLWAKKPVSSKSRHLLHMTGAPWIRRLDFPTWSWASIIGEIHNEQHAIGSVYSGYHQGPLNYSAQNDAHLQFWQFSQGQQVPLREIIQQLRSNAVPEESPYLVVEGDLLRVKVNPARRNFCYCEQNDKKLEFGGRADLDLAPPPTPLESNISLTSHTADQEGSDSVEDALILLEWYKSRATNKKRMVMMLLTWVTNDRAERKGLLCEYGYGGSKKDFKSIPKTRRKFILQ